MKNKKAISPISFVTAILVVLLFFCLIYVSNIGFSIAIVVIAGCYSIWQIIKQWCYYRQEPHSKVAMRERILRVLASWMFFFLVSGSAMFLWAFNCEHTDPNDEPFLFVNAEYLFRSIACSINLFMLDIDSNILDQIKGHEYLKGAISIQAVLSFSCTIAVLISLIYARVKAYIKLHRQTNIDNDHNHLYVFFGTNEAARLLAKSIRKKEGGKALIIIVEKNPVDEENRNGWDSIVNMFTHRGQIFSEADELDARVTFTETRLCDIDKDKLTQSDILGEINLIMLRNLIQQLAEDIEDAQLHVFFLSDNEYENIRAMSTLAQDKTINDVNEKITQRFYCHARRNGLTRVIEDIAVKRGLEVQIIDSAHLAIELLKANDKYHPVRLVEVDKDNPTTVKSEFNGLIVGFEEAGQDALKFLYEFGAFVDSTATPENEKRSPFHCTVVDTNMENLRGKFEAFSPAAISQTNTDGTPLITFKSCNYQSKEFFKTVLEPLCSKLSYVIIAVGDDEQGMLLAVRIFNYVRRKREDLSQFRIFVRSYHSDKVDYMQKITRFYNEGYNNDCGDKHTIKTDEIIVLFGMKEDIYTYDMIVGEDLTIKGKRFQEGYVKMKKGKELWDIRRAVYLGAKKYQKDASGNETVVPVRLGERKTSINNIRSLRRKEWQDLANALHTGTKLMLLKKAFGNDYDWNDFLKRYFESDGETPHCEGTFDMIHYPGLTSEENKAILNLARLEHIRWNASHEMLGYIKAEDDLHGCDERKRQHNCLRPWNELDDESKAASKANGWNADYKSFDFSVVDISILLHKDELPTTQER